MGRRGKREYVQVLRLLETFSMSEVPAAIKDALRLGAISFDAVKHLVLCRLEGRPPDRGMYFNLRLTQLIVTPDSR